MLDQLILDGSNEIMSAGPINSGKHHWHFRVCNTLTFMN